MRTHGNPQLTEQMHIADLAYSDEEIGLYGDEMNSQEIAQLRQTYNISDNQTDEEIQLAQNFLKKTPYLVRPESMLVKNLLELKSIRKTHYSSKSEVLSSPYGLDSFWLFESEILFLYGHYGPCCGWSRATIEFYLQKRCLAEKNAQYTKTKEDSKGRNPGVLACLRILAYPKDGEVDKLCQYITDAAGQVLHHRLEELVSDQAVADKYRNTIDVKGIGILSEHKDVLRYDFERDKAKESMEKLYKLHEMKVLF